MRALIISRRLWWTLAWSGAIALALALHFETDYRDRLARLPALVDAHGHTASVDTAIAGLDSYEQAKRVRKFGFVCLGVGLALFICAATTTRKEIHDA